VKLFECVPNFSEGRDAAKIEKIAAAARDVVGVTVLDVESNADHNRCVISLVGDGDALLDAVLRMMRFATQSIDLTSHRGEHPRMGATDVVPFVPLGESTMDDAVALADRLGRRVAEELAIPVYLYAAAARRPERADLAKVREGQFEGIRDAIGSDPKRAPDYGAAKIHPTAGAVAIGARPVLIAYNAYLSTPDVSVAKKVARAVRGRDGGLTEVKALGFEIQQRQRAQVSMNLTDYRKTPIHRALESVRREAARYGAHVEESEIVGLVPEDALFDAAEYYLQLNRFDRATVLERKVRSAGQATEVEATAEPFGEFVARVAARTPTPGGGSASAAAAALGVALGEMVLAYSIAKDQVDPDLSPLRAELAHERERFLELIGEDSASYDGVRAARAELKARPIDPKSQQQLFAAIRDAAEVPLETARRAVEVAGRLMAVRGRTKAALASDLTTALALLRAAREGALANVAINLDELKAAGEPVAELDAELNHLRETGA
jgi:glutamate formiminotransferase / formiminotetrahydrofolate cyclodeaminase